LESKARLKELNLFFLPRVIETVYKMLRRRGISLDFRFMDEMIFAVVMGLTNLVY
jgi:hypothetical protein